MSDAIDVDFDFFGPTREQRIAGILQAMRFLARDTIDYLGYDHGGFTAEGLTDRFKVLEEELDELERLG